LREAGVVDRLRIWRHVDRIEHVEAGIHGHWEIRLGSSRLDGHRGEINRIRSQRLWVVVSFCLMNLAWSIIPIR
jgi:hypothetical protein